ncbi:MAG: FlgO family outer membrane protein [Candidatus Omnitrophota bacterium]
MTTHRRLINVLCIGIFFILLLQPISSWAYEKEIRELAGTIGENITKAAKTRIAVVDFTDLQGNVTELGRFIAEEFAVALLGKGQGFEMVDRTHLQALIKENKLSATGLIDPATAQKLGQIAGVDALITGSITPFGDTVRLSVKILDAKSAKLIGAVSANLPKTKAIEELLDKSIGSASPVDTGNSSSSASPSSSKAIEVNGFVFKPVSCIRKGSETVFTVSMMNNGEEDREVRVYASSNSFLVDNLGNKYDVYVKIGSRSDSSWIDEKFPPKVPVNVSFIAKEVNIEATLLNVLISIQGFKNVLPMRNIPIVKKN